MQSSFNRDLIVYFRRVKVIETGGPGHDAETSIEIE